MRPIRLALTLALVAAAPGLAPAQTAQPLAKAGCSQQPVEPATPVTSTEKGGGNSGATGWSGAGLGGAFSGTSQAGPVRSSPSFQPVTAKGIDPIKGLPAKAC